MFHYIRKYPLSLLVIAAVLYLSFFSPPSVGVQIPHLDKLAHFCMYAGLSGMLWFEFLRSHRRNGYVVLWRAWIGAALCPVLLSGVIELLQENLTSYRGGEWMDFAANTGGVTAASLFAYAVLRPWILKKV